MAGKPEAQEGQLRFFPQILLSLLLAQCLCPAHSSDAVRDGYLFTTNEYDWGIAHTYVSPDGFKKSLAKQKLAMVASKPTWRITAFQTAEKQICEVTPREQPLRSLPPATRVLRIKCRLKGLPVIKETYYFKPMEIDETQSLVGAFMPSGNAAKSKLIITGVESTLFSAPSYSQELLRASARAMGVPASTGIVLEHSWIISGGKRMGGWSLVEWKRVPVRLSMFTPPSNYSRCSSFHELIGKSISTDMDDVAKQMNFGEPLGSSPTR